ncbi:hypothetical protein SK128_010630 [Halocaridina rubra]|uniref:Uncharacterized protein n=1 Tax=Halocaridina rubra TaxID=373956 RepID=A0AAN8XAF7_HALRR
MAVPHQLLALVLCLWSLSEVFSFNLEPRIPIVKKGSPKSHFGYTVAQHQTILDTISGEKHKKSCLSKCTCETFNKKKNFLCKDLVARSSGLDVKVTGERYPARERS